MTPTIPSKDGKIPPLGLQRKELGPPAACQKLTKALALNFNLAQDSLSQPYLTTEWTLNILHQTATQSQICAHT